MKFAGEQGLLEKSGHGAVYNLACAYARGKRTNDAFATLKRFFSAVKAQRRSEMIAHAKQDSDLEGLREKPEWEELLNKYGKQPPPKEGDGGEAAEEKPPEGRGEE